MITQTKKPTDKPQREGDRVLGGNVKFTTTFEPLAKKLGEYVKLLDLYLEMTADGKQNKGWFICRVPADQTDKLLAATIVLDGRILRLQRAR
jgi:hypothetical protein